MLSEWIFIPPSLLPRLFQYIVINSVEFDRNGVFRARSEMVVSSIVFKRVVGDFVVKVDSPLFSLRTFESTQNAVPGQEDN
jgi:hypothetical protein